MEEGVDGPALPDKDLAPGGPDRPPRLRGLAHDAVVPLIPDGGGNVEPLGAPPAGIADGVCPRHHRLRHRSLVIAFRMVAELRRDHPGQVRFDPHPLHHLEPGADASDLDRAAIVTSVDPHEPVGVRRHDDEGSGRSAPAGVAGDGKAGGVRRDRQLMSPAEVAHGAGVAGAHAQGVTAAELDPGGGGDESHEERRFADAGARAGGQDRRGPR